MYELFLSVINFIESLGYIGIFIMTFVEGSLIPIPSEITLIPAGYLVTKGSFHIVNLLIISILGTLAGAIFSYYIALRFGRELLVKHGKYIFINSTKLAKIESFFEKHGAISTFTGRMLPGLKHFISVPAGLGKMNFKLFTIYSAAGSTIWVSILIAFGYFIGDNEALISKYLKYFNVGLVAILLIVSAFFIVKIFTQYKTKKP